MRGFGGRTAIAIAGTEEPRPARTEREILIPDGFRPGILPGTNMDTLQWEIVCFVLKGTSTTPHHIPLQFPLHSGDGGACAGLDNGQEVYKSRISRNGAI